MGKPRNQPARVKSDEIEFVKDGTIRICLGGTSQRLRRPSIGELQDLLDLLDSCGDEQREFAKLPADERPRLGFEAPLFAWWRHTVELLGEGEKFPDNEDLPPWLCVGSLPGEAKTHWLSVPWGPGGSPSQMEANRQAAQVASLVPALTSLVTAVNVSQQEPSSYEAPLT